MKEEESYKARSAKLSPSTVKKADKTSKSSLLNSFEKAIERVLANANSSQLEKSEIHKKLTSCKYMKWVFVLS